MPKHTSARIRNHGYTLQPGAKIAEVPRQAVFLDVAGEAESAAKEHEHIPGQALGRLPVHHKLTPAQVDGQDKQQQAANHRDAGIRKQRHMGHQPRLEDPAERRKNEYPEHKPLASRPAAEFRFLSLDERCHARDLRVIEAERHPGEHEPDDR
jgi:hypothetical protein